MSESDERKANSRRGFIVNGLKALGAVFGLSLGIPLAGFALNPLRRQEKFEAWISLTKVSDLMDTRPTKVIYEYERQDGWTHVATQKMAFVVQNDDGTYTVLSNRCPHLGCGVDWDATAGFFRCPCHGGVFDLKGQVVEGPPPRALTLLASKVEDGTIFIQEA